LCSRYNTPQYGRNGTAHAAGASILSPVRGVFAARMRSACGVPDGLPLGSATHFQCCHSNATRASNANPPNSAQLGGIPYHSAKLHPGSCNSLGMRPRTDTQTDKQTDRQASWFLRPDCAPSSECPQFGMPAELRSLHAGAARRLLQSGQQTHRRG